MNKYFLAGVVLALTVATSHAGEMKFKEVDINKINGGNAITVLKEIDINGDKTISPEEAVAVKGLPEKFNEADSNKDGKLDEAEFVAIVESSTSKKDKM